MEKILNTYRLPFWSGDDDEVGFIKVHQTYDDSYEHKMKCVDREIKELSDKCSCGYYFCDGVHDYDCCGRRN